MLIVVGGYDDTYLDSTEVMDYTTMDGSWKEVSSMQWREVKTTSFFGFLILILFHNHLDKSKYQKLNYSNDKVTPMPSPKNGVRGASVGGIFHVVGASV